VDSLSQVHTSVQRISSGCKPWTFCLAEHLEVLPVEGKHGGFTCRHVLHDADAEVLVHHGVQAAHCASQQHFHLQQVIPLTVVEFQAGRLKEACPLSPTLPQGGSMLPYNPIQSTWPFTLTSTARDSAVCAKL
jgi:hypothetical protein